MIQQSYKKSLFFIIFLSSTMLLIGIWAGGKNKYTYSDLNFDPDNISELIAQFEVMEKENQLSIEDKYNLSVLVYKNKNYEKSKESFQELLNSGTGESNILISGFYNLGNNFFKLAEAKKEPEKALELYHKSLTSFRGAMELVDRDQKFFREETKKDDDILHNFILTKNRIKILTDQLKTNKQAEKQQQKPYQLIKQIESNESQVETLVKKLQPTANTKEILGIKEEIIKLRKENLDSIAIIKKQIQEQNNQKQSSSPPTPLKPSKQLTI